MNEDKTFAISYLDENRKRIKIFDGKNQSAGLHTLIEQAQAKFKEKFGMKMSANKTMHMCLYRFVHDVID